MLTVKKALRGTFLGKTYRSFCDLRQGARCIAHELEMMSFYSKFVPHNALCFDIGANIGNRVKVFLRLNARVVAVEPQEDCVKKLRDIYGRNSHLVILQEALGDVESDAELMVSNARTLSSLSSEWVEAVKKSGRFAECNWDIRRPVHITTLDGLIEKYGIPTFIKIDVEGYEYHVIKGLSQPVNSLSIEFTPEYIESTFKCIEYLHTLGSVKFNYSLGETMHLEQDEWVSPQKMIEVLQGLESRNHELFGDVYAQFQLSN